MTLVVEKTEVEAVDVEIDEGGVIVEVAEIKTVELEVADVKLGVFIGQYVELAIPVEPGVVVAVAFTR